MLPFPIRPMLLQTAGNPFDSEDHIYEWKVDGIRGILFYDKGVVRLQSKTGKDCTRQFPELLSAKVRAEEAIFDGEIAVITGGKPDFERVMERYMAGLRRIESLTHTVPAVYIVWDILWLNGSSLMDKPLMERKRILGETLDDTESVMKIDYVDTEGSLLWGAIREHQLEGIVAKNKTAKYHAGRRNAAFTKIKSFRTAQVNVFGYSKRNGSVLVGTDDRVQGHAMGIRPQDRSILWGLLREYGTEKGPVIYLPPGIKGRVKYTTWSSKGNMRDCCWEGFQI